MPMAAKLWHTLYGPARQYERQFGSCPVPETRPSFDHAGGDDDAAQGRSSQTSDGTAVGDASAADGHHVRLPEDKKERSQV